MGQAIEILPKTLFTAEFVQAPEEAIDVGANNQLILQTWLAETLSGSEQVEVIIEQTVVNEDGAYDTSTPVLTVTYDGTLGPTTGTQIEVALSTLARFIRVRVKPTSYTGSMTVRAVAILRRTN